MYRKVSPFLTFRKAAINNRQVVNKEFPTSLFREPVGSVSNALQWQGLAWLKSHKLCVAIVSISTVAGPSCYSYKRNAHLLATKLGPHEYVVWTCVMGQTMSRVEECGVVASLFIGLTCFVRTSLPTWLIVVKVKRRMTIWRSVQPG